MITLMDGLDALSHLTKKTLKKGYQFEEFNEAVPCGVSANLCEALVTSSKPKSLDAPIHVSVTWSDLMTFPKTSVREVDFDPTQLAFVGMAARDFRERNEEEIVLEGFVVALSRESPTSQREPPRITLATIVENRLRRVHIAVLVPVDYDLAIQAHGSNSTLRVQGTLKQSGRFLWLEGARHFEAESEQLG